jgi:hypothetical protein
MDRAGVASSWQEIGAVPDHLVHGSAALTMNVALPSGSRPRC